MADVNEQAQTAFEEEQIEDEDLEDLLERREKVKRARKDLQRREKELVAELADEKKALAAQWKEAADDVDAELRRRELDADTIYRSGRFIVRVKDTPEETKIVEAKRTFEIDFIEADG